MVDHVAMKAYSEDLRQKVVQAVEQRGTSKSEVARLFGISPTTSASNQRIKRSAGRFAAAVVSATMTPSPTGDDDRRNAPTRTVARAPDLLL